MFKKIDETAIIEGLYPFNVRLISQALRLCQSEMLKIKFEVRNFVLEAAETQIGKEKSEKF